MIEIWSSDLPLWHPKRITFKVLNVIVEACCRPFFSWVFFGENLGNTSIKLSTTGEQRSLLLNYAKLCEGAIVELGAWEGTTTRSLATCTSSPVYAVDLFWEGWQPAAAAHKTFIKNTFDLENVTLLRQPTITAGNEYIGPKVGLLFIDAQHNFLCTIGDYMAWKKHLGKGALVALHDVDNKMFPGTRLAAWLISKRLHRVAHVDNLLILRSR